MGTIRLGLFNAHQAHKVFMEVWMLVKPVLLAGHRLQIEVRKEKRSDPQNRRMWAMLRDISQQVDWYGQQLSEAEWKDVFSAAMKKQKVVPGLDGGFVVCGQRTSQMTKAEMSDMQTLMEAFGAERNVKWTEPEREHA